MATMSFDQVKTNVPADVIEVEATVASSEQLPTTSTNQEIAVHVEADKSGFAGEVNRSDIQLPYISIVQKTSDMVEDFKPGSLVFAKDVLLGTTGQPVEIIVLKLAKVYEEDVPYGSSDVRPQIFSTMAEARAKGFDDAYGAPKRVVNRGDMDVLVKMPKVLANPLHESMFAFEAGTDKYALARWTVRKGAYRTTASVLITALTMGNSLKNGIWSVGWNLTVESESNAKNSWYQPYLKASCKTSDAVLELIKEIKG